MPPIKIWRFSDAPDDLKIRTITGNPQWLMAVDFDFLTHNYMSLDWLPTGIDNWYLGNQYVVIW